MSQSSSQQFQQGIEAKPMHEFAEQAYLDYAMYVILDRALPHVADGLKPVQRRLVYAMSELGLKATAKYKKSARTIGDVLGKFHPHGDTACYEAMVLMAQPFSYRYPLVDGQGNWGSIDDPKSFAAMRYTEARLAPYAQVLLQEVGQGTVTWVSNFDGTLQEPARLPARLPNVLLNGASGIAVGMATDIPPHNLREVVDACIHLLDAPNASIATLCRYVKGPDFPSGAEIVTPASELLNLYETGRGSLKVRASYEHQAQEVIITALPYQVSSTKVMQQIAEQMRLKKLPMVTDLQDQSDEACPVRVVLTLRSNRVDVTALMSHLFATTDLQKQVRVNLNMIGLDQSPQVMNLRTICTQWLTYRTETVRRRLNHRLDAVQDRLHVLAGLLIAYLHLDEVIKIVRTCDEPLHELMQRYGLTERQATAILNIRLRQLAKLEQIALETEQADLKAEEASLLALLSSDDALKKLIKQELRADAKAYGDARRTVIRDNAPVAQILVERIPIEPVSLIMSVQGWVRLAKGHVNDAAQLSFKAQDQLLHLCHGRSDDAAIVWDNVGRAYTLTLADLPSARTHGDPLTKFLKPVSQTKFEQVILASTQSTVLLMQDSGFGFVTTVDQLMSKNKAGKAIVSLTTHAALLKPAIDSNNAAYVAIVTSDGHFLVFSAAEVAQLNRGKGAALIRIPKARRDNREELVVASTWLNEADAIQFKVGRRTLTLKTKDWQLFLGKKGGRGQLLPRGFRQVSAMYALPPKRNDNAIDLTQEDAASEANASQ